jgi:HK97 family phage major capsid protein
MISEEVGNQLAEFLQQKHGFSTTTQLDKAVSDLLKRTDQRQASGNRFSLSTMIRGLRALKGEAINESTKQSDIEYVRALSTGATPGSYLVPTIQANEIIAMLSLGGVARSAGVRIWDMAGVQKINVPSATTAPTWEWLGQNTSQAATDANLGQLAFDLKERRCLTVVPNQLIAVSVPGFDTLLAQMIGQAAGEHEDTAIFATTTVTNGPAALYATATTSTLLVGGSANGGNIAYSDIVATLAKAAAAKAKGPFVWFASPRTFYTRLLGMIDLSSRPIMVPTLTQGLTQGAQNLGVPAAGMLMGYPVYVTPAILENIANGSGTNQSFLVLTNPSYIHVAQDNAISINISTERYFELNETAIRGTQHLDTGYSPLAGVCVLKGIN